MEAIKISSETQASTAGFAAGVSDVLPFSPGTASPGSRTVKVEFMRPRPWMADRKADFYGEDFLANQPAPYLHFSLKLRTHFNLPRFGTYRPTDTLLSFNNLQNSPCSGLSLTLPRSQKHSSLPSFLPEII